MEYPKVTAGNDWQLAVFEAWGAICLEYIAELCKVFRFSKLRRTCFIKETMAVGYPRTGYMYASVRGEGARGLRTEEWKKKKKRVRRKKEKRAVCRKKKGMTGESERGSAILINICIFGCHLYHKLQDNLRVLMLLM